MKNIRFFLSENFHFGGGGGVKFSMYLNRRVFVMSFFLSEDQAGTAYKKQVVFYYLILPALALLVTNSHGNTTDSRETLRRVEI